MQSPTAKRGGGNSGKATPKRANPTEIKPIIKEKIRILSPKYLLKVSPYLAMYHKYENHAQPPNQPVLID